MKPTPAKPRIIIAHVEGSGTLLTLNWIGVSGPAATIELP
jgi:hypothetical protein